MSWESEKIGDICNVGDGAHASIKRTLNGIPYYTSKNFKIDGIDLSKVDYISEEDFKKHFRSNSNAITKPLKDDILLSIIGSIGAPYLVKDEDDFGLSSSVSILRPKFLKIAPLYLYYWIKSNNFQDAVNQIKSGVAQSFLSLSMIKQLPVVYPKSLQTQKRIASILSTYDDLIENNLKRIKLLEETAQNIYKEWFVNFRFPNYENTPFNEETGLPVGWEMKKICELVTFKGGYPFKSSDYTDYGKYRIVTIKNVGDRFFDGENTSGIENIPDKMKDYCKLQEGNILMSLTGNIGRTCLVYGDNFLLNQRVVIIEPINLENNPFCYFLFNTDSIKGLMNNLASGVAQQNLSPVKLEAQSIPLPPLSLMLNFSSISKNVVNQIISLNKQNQKLKEARDILLPRLMNRTIEV